MKKAMLTSIVDLKILNFLQFNFVLCLNFFTSCLKTLGMVNEKTGSSHF